MPEWETLSRDTVCQAWFVGSKRQALGFPPCPTAATYRAVRLVGCRCMLQADLLSRVCIEHQMVSDRAEDRAQIGEGVPREASRSVLLRGQFSCDESRQAE